MDVGAGSNVDRLGGFDWFVVCHLIPIAPVHGGGFVDWFHGLEYQWQPACGGMITAIVSSREPGLKIAESSEPVMMMMMFFGRVKRPNQKPPGRCG